MRGAGKLLISLGVLSLMTSPMFLAGCAQEPSDEVPVTPVAGSEEPVEDDLSALSDDLGGPLEAGSGFDAPFESGSGLDAPLESGSGLQAPLETGSGLDTTEPDSNE